MLFIKLEDEFGVDLGSRSYALELFKKLDDNPSKITIDFENVEFISRSFAQEYLNQKFNAKCEIEEINVHDEVKNMFNVVLKNNDIDMRY